MNFEEAHNTWIQDHLEKRKGERRGRLERGHRHAETLFARNVWWELFGHFDHLHPEYEVPDWRGRSYFADFAWVTPFVKLIIEIKGYATHVRDMDRTKYSQELNRETFLTAMGYTVISFSYDDVEQRPEVCVALLRMVMSRFQSNPSPVSRAVMAEKELIRLAIRLIHPIRPRDVVEHFELDVKTAISMLQKLCAKGWLRPVTRERGERIVRYELVKGVHECLD
ncbi:DUF559 domain-containing protein [Cohnella sp. CFH 77786]|uniref:DUF559 domain-containing protein n=1 Tax=Cohnella sp. CFH 77786 TaxID=2662265 RepID=UPI001C60D4B2|nr:DUF559 domain-containing protein [Cohnella sp. CFH 77786]MBW5447994.1 DUF559 domain-containing protein [Cohnella sp. CFH 77786]